MGTIGHLDGSGSADSPEGGYGGDQAMINLDQVFFQRCESNPFYPRNQHNKDRWFRPRDTRIRTLINRLFSLFTSG